jgi:FlgD Ig-like domain
LQRILSTAVLVGLLAATAAAFAITERLKLTKSPISGTKVTSALSPLAHTTATVSLRFRRRDRVTVTIDDSHRRRIDTLASDLPVRRGRHSFVWDGRTAAGTAAPDGTYRVQVHLATQRRTILIPNPIVVDTIPPGVDSAVAPRLRFSPDGDHQADAATIRFTLSKPAHALVYLRGQRIIRSRFASEHGAVKWYGRLAGRLLPPGAYVLSVGAEDPAGNRTPAAKRVPVRVVIRYIALAKGRVAVVPRARFRIGVSTDAQRYRWQLGARKGSARGAALTLRAPAQPGRYLLTVTERGHADRALVVVG